MPDRPALVMAQWRGSAVLLILLLSLVSSLWSTAVHAAVRGFDLQTFDRIYMHGDASVLLEQNAQGGATAEGPAARLEQLNMEVVDRVLYIDAGDSEDVAELKIHLPVVQLKEIVSQGASVVAADTLSSHVLTLEGHGNGRFAIRRLQLDDLSIIGKGATEFALGGRTRNQMVDLSGVGRYDGAALASRNSQVNIKGSGHVDVLAEEVLDVNITGNASVRYDGAAWVLQQITGAGSIARR